jgi:hypothetical protein
MRWRLVLLAGLLMALALPSAANAAVRSVSQSGADVGPCTLSPCRHIAYATTQANPGDTVSVDTGTYVETQVLVNKPLTLQGAGIGQTIVKQDPANPNSTPEGLIRIASPSTGDITISGFTLAGANRHNPNDEPFTVYATQVPAGGTVTVTNNSFLEDTTLDPGLSSDYSVGFYGTASAATFHISSNRFQGMFQAVFLEANTGPATIAGNEFTGLLASDCGDPSCGSLRLPQGVFMLADAGATNTSKQSIANNTFHNFAGQPITFNAAGAGSTFSDLEVVGNLIDVQGATDSTGRPPNGVHAATRDSGAISSLKITGNTISMAGPAPSRAAIFSAESSGATAGSTSGIVARFNRIIGNSNFGVQNDSAPTIDAAENWWGCNTGPNTAGCTKTGGTGGPITSSPYLVLSANASPASVAQNQQSTITASLTKDSAGNTPSGNVFPSGVPVGFATDLGSVSPTSSPTTGPVATSSFSSANAGTANVKATLDNATVSTPVVVAATPAPPGPAAPTVAFDQPPAGTTLTVGHSTPVALTVTAPAGAAAVSVSFNGRQVCSFTTGPYTCTFTPRAGDADRAGTFVAVVTDTQGRSASASRAVVVGGPASLGSRTATVSGGSARVRILCPSFGPCRGTLTLRARVRGRRGTRLVSVGSATFNLTGRAGIVRVPVANSVLAGLARKHYFNTRATVVSAGVSATRNLVLHTHR